MQSTTMNIDALQGYRPAGISLEEGMAALKCEISRLWHTKSETFSLMCEEPVTYGDVVLTLLGFVIFFLVMAFSGFLFGGEVM